MNFRIGNYYSLHRHGMWYVFQYGGRPMVNALGQDRTWLTEMRVGHYDDEARQATWGEMEFYNSAVRERDLGWVKNPVRFENQVVKYSVGQILQREKLFGKITDIRDRRGIMYDITWSDGEDSTEIEQFLDECEVINGLSWSQITDTKKKWRLF